jgi:hypothetical protein
MVLQAPKPAAAKAPKLKSAVRRVKTYVGMNDLPEETAASRLASKPLATAMSRGSLKADSSGSRARASRPRNAIRLQIEHFLVPFSSVSHSSHLHQLYFLAAVHFGPPRISGFNARAFNVQRHGRQAKSLPPEAKCGGSVHAGGGLVHRGQRLIKREGVGLLDRREIFEGRRPLPRRRLRAVHHENVVDVPLPVRVRRLIRAL